MKTILRSAVLAMLALLFLPSSTRAEMPGRHPAYLHALGNLRMARFDLERRHGDREMRWDEGAAIREIDASIRELKLAAIDDGKRLDGRFMDRAGRLDRGGRLHEALKFLREARQEIHEREDALFGHGLRDRALDHLDKAIRFTEEGVASAQRR